MTSRWVLGAVLLAGCSPAKQQTGQTPAPSATSIACNVGTEVLKPHVGQAYTDQLGEELKRQSRSTVLRVVRPGEVMTMDFRADRLTVRLDDQERFASARCG